MGKHLQSGWTFKIKIEIWISVFTGKVRNHGLHTFVHGTDWLGLWAPAFPDWGKPVPVTTTSSCPSDTEYPQVGLDVLWVHWTYTVLFLDFAVSQCWASVPLLRPCSRLPLSPLLWLPAHTPTHHEASDPENSNYFSALLWESFIQSACMGTPHLIVVDYFSNIFSQLDCEFVRKREYGLSLFTQHLIYSTDIYQISNRVW